MMITSCCAVADAIVPSLRWRWVPTLKCRRCQGFVVSTLVIVHFSRRRQGYGGQAPADAKAMAGKPRGYGYAASTAHGKGWAAGTCMAAANGRRVIAAGAGTCCALISL